MNVQKYGKKNEKKMGGGKLLPIQTHFKRNPCRGILKGNTWNGNVKFNLIPIVL